MDNYKRKLINKQKGEQHPTLHNNMSKKKTSWQISEATFAKVKQQATKDKVAIQVKAEQLILIALEGKSK